MSAETYLPPYMVPAAEVNPLPWLLLAAALIVASLAFGRWVAVGMPNLSAERRGRIQRRALPILALLAIIAGVLAMAAVEVLP